MDSEEHMPGVAAKVLVGEQFLRKGSSKERERLAEEADIP